MKTIDAKLLTAAVALALGPSIAASACEATLELDTDQVRHHLETLKSADADELDQLDVLAALMWRRSAGRARSYRQDSARFAQSLGPGGDAVGRDAAKEEYGGRVRRGGGISNEVRSYIQDEIALEYTLNHVEEDASCIGLDTNKSCKGYFLDITGGNVEITYGRDLGSFSLDESGELKGFFKPANLKAKVPAKIRLL